MQIHGFDIVFNRRDAKRWMKEHHIDYPSFPESYPAIVEDRIGADENGYANYFTEGWAMLMLDAIRKAVAIKREQRKATKRRPAPAPVANPTGQIWSRVEDTR
jgi:hypothetical protein